jgi:mannosidase alpha-like ER degradation enhancer 2
MLAPPYLILIAENMNAIEKYLKREDWYMWAQMKKGTVTQPVFQSLEAYWPGLLVSSPNCYFYKFYLVITAASLFLSQSLIGEIEKGMRSIHNYHQVWKQFGFTPEFYNIAKNDIYTNREGYPLRPGKLILFCFLILFSLNTKY